MAQWHHLVSCILVNIGSDYGLLFDITKPLLKWIIGSLSICSKGKHLWWCHDMKTLSTLFALWACWEGNHSDITWASWCIKSHVTKLFDQQFAQPTIRQHEGFTLLTLCVGNPPAIGGFSSQRASNVEIVSIWWCHHSCCHGSWHCHVILSWPVRTPAQTPDNGTDNAWQSWHSSMHSP